MNRVEYEIRLKDSFTPGLKKATSSMNEFESKLGGLQNMAGKLGIALSFAAVGAGIKKLSDLGAAAEQTRISFEVLTGSSAKGNKLLGELKEFANITPYVSKDVLDTSKVMLGFGIVQEKILPTMKMLGDVASGDAERLKSLGLVYGQINAAGRLMGQDLLQLINNGFNPLQIMAARSGKKIGELKKMMEDGAISANDVAKAFKIATSEGGLFFDMTNRQSQTFAGKISTLIDLLEVKGTDIGDALNKKLTPILDKILLIFDKTKDPVATEVKSLQKANEELSKFRASLDNYKESIGTEYEKQAERDFLSQFPVAAKGIDNEGMPSGVDTLKANSYGEFLLTQKRSFAPSNRFYESEDKLKYRLGILNENIANGKDEFGRSLDNNKMKDVLKEAGEIYEKLNANAKQLQEYQSSRGKASSADKNKMVDNLLMMFGLSRKTGPKFAFETGDEEGKKKHKGKNSDHEERLGGTKNITINVAKLIGIETNQNSTNTDPRAIGEAVKKELLTALHDANLAIQN